MQFGDEPLISPICAVPPLTLIDTDTADCEIYCGLRAADAGGCEIVKTSFPATSADVRTAGVLEPPPPQPARSRPATRNGAACRVMTWRP
jgi:hypothetical protein